MNFNQSVNYFKKFNHTKSISAHSNKVHSLAWNCRGQMLATGSYDKNISLFNFDKEGLEHKQIYRGHFGSVDQLVWHPTNPNLFASASVDKTLRIWDARSQQNCVTVNTKGENINIAWSPDGKHIGVGSNEDLITFIDASTSKIISEYQFRYEVNEITWDPTGNLFALTSGEGAIHIHSYTSNFDASKESILKGHSVNCICIKFSNDGKYLACGSADASVSLWNTKNFICERVITRQQWPVRSLAFSHDSRLIAIASEDNGVDIAHVHTGEQVHLIKTIGSTFSVAWNPTKYVLAFSSEGKVDRDQDVIHLFGFES